MAKAVNETVKNYENCENHENRENLKISLKSSILDISAGIWTLFEKKNRYWIPFNYLQNNTKTPKEKEIN